MCFGHEEADAAPTAPGKHSHDHHEGPDNDASCCTDVPAETGGPWIVVQLALPLVGFAEPALGPRTPPASPSVGAPPVVPVRTTVLLR